MPYLDTRLSLDTRFEDLLGRLTLAEKIFLIQADSKFTTTTIPRLGNHPGTNGTITYAEDLLVGYRWFDTKNIETEFPFGFGLSYTTFKYSSLKLIPGTNETLTAQFEIENTGKVAGADVAQVDIHETKPRLMRPEQELKGFKKVFLKTGESQIEAIPLNSTAFAFYDPVMKKWLAEKDPFTIHIGSSSRDLPLKPDFQITDTIVLE